MQLPAELTLAELGIQDRDKLELRAHTDLTKAVGESAAVETAVLALTGIGADLDSLELQLAAGEALHQELFTRMLEALDGIVLDGCASMPHPAEHAAPEHAQTEAPLRTLLSYFTDLFCVQAE